MNRKPYPCSSVQIRGQFVLAFLQRSWHKRQFSACPVKFIPMRSAADFTGVPSACPVELGSPLGIQSGWALREIKFYACNPKSLQPHSLLPIAYHLYVEKISAPIRLDPRWSVSNMPLLSALSIQQIFAPWCFKKPYGFFLTFTQKNCSDSHHWMILNINVCLCPS